MSRNGDPIPMARVEVEPVAASMAVSLSSVVLCRMDLQKAYEN